MHAEDPRRINRDTAQLIIEEMENELEKQKRLLEKKDREIEELHNLLDSGGLGFSQNPETEHTCLKDGLDMVYEIISCLENYTTEEVLFYAAPILSELMETDDVAVYMMINKDYARLFSSTSSEARQLGNSIKYSSMETLYNELESKRVYVNKDMAPDSPMMASGIYAEDEIQVILMFWGIPDRQMNLSKADRLTVITTLVQNSILRAKRHMAGFRRRNYIEGTNVLNKGAFTSLVTAFLEAKSKGLTECTLVEIIMGYQNFQTISEKIACHIRQTDYMGIMDDGKLYILLSNTDLKHAETVKERLLKLGYQSILRETII